MEADQEESMETDLQNQEAEDVVMVTKENRGSHLDSQAINQQSKPEQNKLADDIREKVDLAAAKESNEETCPVTSEESENSEVVERERETQKNTEHGETFETAIPESMTSTDKKPQEDFVDIKMFTQFSEHLAQEKYIRKRISEKVKALELSCRVLSYKFSTVHQEGGMKEVPSLCAEARDVITKLVKPQIEELAGEVPKGEYYRFNEDWRDVFQQLSFLVSFLVYLERSEVAQEEEVSKILGISDVGFHLVLDDFLIGLLQLPTELNHLAKTCVIAGDYSRPVQISRLVRDLNSAFKCLKLKNDYLRKRYDGLKYDIQKINQVVNDLIAFGLAESC